MVGDFMMATVHQQNSHMGKSWSRSLALCSISSKGRLATTSGGALRMS